MCHHHLTLEEREMIMKYQILGCGVSEIARHLKRNKSTISRELRRNRTRKEYIPVKAEAKYRKRRKKCRRHKRLEDPVLHQYVTKRFLEDQWSPEQIAGRLSLETDESISYITIYRAIYSGMIRDEDPHNRQGKISRHLRHKGKRRHTKGYEERRGKIQISHEISERPGEAAERSRLGDWEADTVLGKPGRACLVTLADRKSRYLCGGKADAKKAEDVNVVMIHSLQGQPMHSITPDRGKEFAKHAEVTAALAGVPFYFPQPHHPWERGTNENTNGLLREYFPKGVDITDVSEEAIQAVYDKLNRRPRKCLGFRTPYEVHYSTSLHLI